MKALDILSKVQIREVCLDCGSINSFHAVLIEDPFSDGFVEHVECAGCEAPVERCSYEEQD